MFTYADFTIRFMETLFISSKLIPWAYQIQQKYWKNGIKSPNSIRGFV